MSVQREISPPGRRDVTAAAIVRRWRELTGGRGTRDAERRTMVACSGGADSSALVLALARVRPSVTVAHIVHDLRPADQSLADRGAVRALAGALGLKFVEASVRVRESPVPRSDFGDRSGGEGSGRIPRERSSLAAVSNIEARARRARYDALAALARVEGCVWVVTAHHADDQLETVLMRLMRGAGPAGLGGIAEARPLGRGVTLLRPMLAVPRDDARRLCLEAGWAWQEDATNADEGLLRSAVRHRLVPVLLGLAPAARERVATTARLLRGAGDVVAQRALELMSLARTDVRERAGIERGAATPLSLEWPRGALRTEPAVVLGELLRSAVAMVGDGDGLDRLPARSVLRIAEAVRSESTEPKRFRLGPACVRLTARTLSIGAVSTGEPRREGSPVKQEKES